MTEYFVAMLDQMLVNRGLLLDESPLQIDAASIETVRFVEHLDHHGAPRRLGLPSRESSFDKTGLSDHLPVACRVAERQL